VYDSGTASAGGQSVLHDVLELGLEERNHTGLQLGHLVGVDVDGHHVVAQLGHSRGVRRPQIARPDHRNLHPSPQIQFGLPRLLRCHNRIHRCALTVEQVGL
jgi:hypothetical protein